MRLRARLAMAICLAVFVFGLFVSSSSYAEIIGLWLFDDEDEGDEAEDSSGKGNNGKLDGPEWVDGKFGKALEFKDVGDRVDVGSNMQPEKDISVVAWLYNYGVPEEFGMILVKSSEDRAYQVMLFQDELAFLTRDKNDTQSRINEGANHPERSVSKDQWTHIAAVADSATKKMMIYVNGEEVSDLDYPGNLKPGASRAGIGNKTEKSARHQFLGIIDEFAVFDHTLTQQEIRNIMDKGLAVAVLGKRPEAVFPLNSLATTWSSVRIDGKERQR